MDEFIWLTLFFSSVIVVTSWLVAPREANWQMLLTMMACIGAGSIYLSFSTVLLLHAAIMSLLICVWAISGCRPALLRTFAILAPILPYAAGITDNINSREKVAQLRATYPVVSVAERLAYEKGPAKSAESVVTSVALSPAVQTELESQEQRLQSQQGLNEQFFEQLHTATFDRFADSAGFGSMRMRSFYTSEPKRPAPVSLAQPEQAAPAVDDATPEAVAARASNEVPERVAAPSRSMLDMLHFDGAWQFAWPRGYIENRDHVVGFEPHRFESVPQLQGKSGGAWRLARLELVSLLKQPEPRVYVSEHLPRMDELKDAPTRPLDAFEARSLPQLRTERDTVVDEATNEVRMLGAVRAGKTCLQCHNVERGELLGAFSYVIRRTPPMPVPAPKSSDVKSEL